MGKRFVDGLVPYILSAESLNSNNFARSTDRIFISDMHFALVLYTVLYCLCTSLSCCLKGKVV